MPLSSSRAAAATAAMLFVAAATTQAQYTATYVPSASGLPRTTEQGQSGTNNCGTGASATSMCQNLYINDINDWCVWGPPNGGAVADNERVEVSYCTQAGRGTRLIPPGTILGAHFVKTPSYVQITGTGDFTKIGITPGDEGGELDPHGADGNGNPIGGLVFHNGVQMHEWFSFMSATEFCTRACYDGNRATSLCRHTYDELGCGFNAPGNYDAGVFESCKGKDAQDIMYGYPGLNTFQQADTSFGVQVPSPHAAPPSSQCAKQTGISYGSQAGYSAAVPTASSTGTSGSGTPSTTSSSAPVVVVTSTVVPAGLTASKAPTFAASTASIGGQRAATTSGGARSVGTTSTTTLVVSSLAVAITAGMAFML